MLRGSRKQSGESVESVLVYLYYWRCTEKWHTYDKRREIVRAAVGMEIPMEIPMGMGTGVGMGMICHPTRPMGILWGFLINLK